MRWGKNGEWVQGTGLPTEHTEIHGINYLDVGCSMLNVRCSNSHSRSSRYSDAKSCQSVCSLIAGKVLFFDGLTGNWKDGNNWNPDGTVVVTNATGAHRLNVNGAQISNYTADQGTTVYAGDPTPSTGGGRGLVIASPAGNSGSMRISGGSFSTSGSTAPDVLGNGNGSTSLLLIDGGTRISFF